MTAADRLEVRNPRALGVGLGLSVARDALRVR
jgi:hypothetical protein